MTRIGIIGNLANVGYELARALSGVDLKARLVIPRNRLDAWRRVVTDRAPEDDPLLHVVGAGPHCTPWALAALRSYDAVVSVCLAGTPMLPFLGRPYVSYATGSDLRELAVGAPIYPAWHAAMARRTFRHARLVLHCPDNSQVDVARTLGLDRAVTCRQFVDLDFWRSTPRLPPADDGLVVAAPAQLFWRPQFPGQPLLKRNDVLLEGFAQFLATGGAGRLVVLRRGIDAVHLDPLIERLGIADHVEVLAGGVTRSELRDLFARAHVVGDQFSPEGGLGLIALEAMAAGRPVLASPAEPSVTLAYGEDAPPVRWAADAAAVSDQLHALGDPAALAASAADGTTWTERQHNPRRLAEWYRNAILAATDA